MSKEKQIEEIAKVLLKASRQDNKDKDVHNDYADFNSDTIWEYGRDRLNGATALYNDGYRKQSEVVSEICTKISETLTRCIALCNNRLKNDIESAEILLYRTQKRTLGDIRHYVDKLKKEYTEGG